MKKQFKILGICYGGHDTSATLMIDGKLISACEEERYNKEKHTRKFPSSAINDCLKKSDLEINDIDEISLIYDPVYAIRETYLKTALNDETRIGFLINDIDKISSLYNMEKTIREQTKFSGKISFHLHHLCHFASSYYVSGFDEALLASFDGMGEIESTLLGVGKGNEISIVHNGNRYPNSLGLFYSAITHYLGWKHHSDEGIIMGLAPYGNSQNTVPNSSKSYKEFFEEIIYETGDFEYVIDKSWISYYNVRDKWISDKFLEIDPNNLSIPIILSNASKMDLRLKAANKAYNNNLISVESLAALYQSVDFNSEQLNNSVKTLQNLSGNNELKSPKFVPSHCPHPTLINKKMVIKVIIFCL